MGWEPESWPNSVRTPSLENRFGLSSLCLLHQHLTPLGAGIVVLILHSAKRKSM